MLLSSEVEDAPPFGEEGLEPFELWFPIVADLSRLYLCSPYTSLQYGTALSTMVGRY